MSWKASAWAKQQRLGSPAAKSILMCLADYADPTGLINGWASQAQLAEDAEVSERSVREWMQRLEAAGLMKRSRRSGANGARATDIIQLNLCVTVADKVEQIEGDDSGDGDVLPAKSAGRSYRQPDAILPADGDSPTGTEFRAYKEEPPLSDQSPPIEREARVRADASGSEVDDAADAVSRETWVKRLKRAHSAWPTFVSDSAPAAEKAWFALLPEERDAAADRAADYLAAAKTGGRKTICSFGVYLAEKRWEKLPEKAAAEAETPAVEQAAPFGKLWGAMRFAELLGGPARAIPRPTGFIQKLIDQGGEAGERERLAHLARHGWPVVNAMHGQAAERRGFTVPDRLKPLADHFGQVKVGGELWDAWERLHRRRGWPWVGEAGPPEWVYMPNGVAADGEDLDAWVEMAVAAFEEALREISDDGAARRAG